MTTIFYTNNVGQKYVYHSDEKPEIVEGFFLKFKDRKLGVMLLPAARCEMREVE